FSTGTGNLSFNGNIVTNITQTGATNLSTGTGTVTLNGNTTVVNGKTLTVGNGDPIKSIELGSCLGPGSSPTTITCNNGHLTNITAATLLVTDILPISAQTSTASACYVSVITAGTSFTITCNVTPGNARVWNVMVVRR